MNFFSISSFSFKKWQIYITKLKLNPNNYVNWLADNKYLLLDKNAWGIVTGKEKAPEVTDTTPDKYQSRVQSALSIIYLNVESEFVELRTDDFHVAWNKITSHFQPDNCAHHMQLFSELLACQIEPEEY